MTEIPDDELKGAFKQAFPPRKDDRTDDSVLASMARQGRSVRGLLLRDLPEEPQVLKPRGGRQGRYQLVGEIARGGVGVVLKGRDVDLGRDVAMKVLRDEHADKAEVLQRFVEEAQIGGQLQHPGIIPIYEMGLNEEKRPYFTMKLVKGETLAERLGDREDPSQGLRGLLAIFERVCDAVAYAHSRGVVHRDLKPANIIIGAFAEVQVVDWGFAKVLGREDTVGARRAEETIVSTVRTEGGSDSIPGSILGTPAYMPPEQALGQVESLDARSDVFALGAILCEILTGEPPYLGDTPVERLMQAQRSDLGEVEQRLKPHALGSLVLECLSAAQSGRPKEAGVVATRIREHLSTAEERAQAARVRVAKQRARAEQERRAKRVVVAIVATVLLALVGGGTTWVWNENRSARLAEERSDAVRLLRDKARLAQGRARERTEELETGFDYRGPMPVSAIAQGKAEWASALGAVREAESLARAGSVTAALGEEVEALRRALEDGEAAFTASLEARTNEHELVAAWDESLLRSGDQWDAAKVDDEILEPLKDLESRGPVESRPTAFKEVVAEYLEFLAVIRQEQLKEKPFVPLLERAMALDPHPVRNQMRTILIEEDREALGRLARSEPLDPAINALNLATALRSYRFPIELRLRLRQREVKKARPLAYWLYSIDLFQAERPREAWQYATAVLALRPNSTQSRHTMLSVMRDPKQRIRFMEDTLKIDPTWGHGWAHIARDRFRLGERDAALRAAREATRISPEDAQAWHYRATITQWVEGPAASVALHRRAHEDERQRLYRPFKAFMLATALTAADRWPEALKVARKAVSENPKAAYTRHTLARVHEARGEKEEAAAAYRDALKDKVVFPAFMLKDLRRLLPAGEGTRAFRDLTKRIPHFAMAHYELGRCLQRDGDPEGAVDALRTSIRLNPEMGEFHYALHRLLPEDEVLKIIETALRGKRHSAKLHSIQAMQLAYYGDHDAATARRAKAIELDPYIDLYAYVRLSSRQEPREAIRTLRAGIEAHPESPVLWAALARRLEKVEGDVGRKKALEAWRRALTLHPMCVHWPKWKVKWIRAWHGLRGHSLEDARTYAVRGLALRPRSAVFWFLSGWLHQYDGRKDEAIAAYRKAIELSPRVDVDAHIRLAQLLGEQSQGEEQVATLRRAMDEFPNLATPRLALARLMDQPDQSTPRRELLTDALPLLNAMPVEFHDQRDGEPALEIARALVEASPSDDHKALLALACYRTGRYEEAATLLEGARDHLEAEPDGIRAHCGAFLAMAQWKSGKKEKARETLAAARAIDLDEGNLEEYDPSTHHTRRALSEAGKLIR